MYAEFSVATKIAFSPPSVELGWKQVDQGFRTHAVEIVVEVELLHDIDKTVYGAWTAF